MSGLPTRTSATPGGGLQQPGHPPQRPHHPPQPTVVDALLTAAVLGASLLLLAHGGFGAGHAGARLDVAGGLLTAAASLPLLAWRRAPLAMFVSVATISTLAAGLGYSVDLPLAPIAAVYLIAVSRDDTRPWTRYTTGLVIAAAVAFLAATAAGGAGFHAVDLVHSGLPWAWPVAWFAGERTRLHRAHVADLEARLARVDDEAVRERRLAVLEERARIARDLHDSAAHAINVIGVQAGAARLRHDPQRTRRALHNIENLARDTVAEIDRLVGLLREPDGHVEAPAGLASLDTLRAQHAAAGLAVDLATIGTPRPLPGPVDQASYRILQEALTNAARHGTGPTRIELGYGQNALSITVTNPAPTRPRSRTIRGHGLIGMHERAALLGGNLSTECRNGRFYVRAQLPYRP